LIFFSQPSLVTLVTSNLDPKTQRADHRQGGSRARNRHDKGRNSFVLKILTSKPLGPKILQAIFANLAPVAAFRGVYPETGAFPKMKLAHVGGDRGDERIFFSRISQDEAHF
jgi:hypothetical protein